MTLLQYRNRLMDAAGIYQSMQQDHQAQMLFGVVQSIDEVLVAGTPYHTNIMKLVGTLRSLQSFMYKEGAAKDAVVIAEICRRLKGIAVC